MSVGFAHNHSFLLLFLSFSKEIRISSSSLRQTRGSNYEQRCCINLLLLFFRPKRVNPFRVHFFTVHRVYNSRRLASLTMELAIAWFPFLLKKRCVLDFRSKNDLCTRFSKKILIRAIHVTCDKKKKKKLVKTIFTRWREILKERERERERRTQVVWCLWWIEIVG